MTIIDPNMTISLAEQINLNVKAEIIRAGHKPADIEHADALNVSHAWAMRRFSGNQEWRLSEIDRLADWLHLHPDDLLTTSR